MRLSTYDIIILSILTFIGCKSKSEEYFEKGYLEKDPQMKIEYYSKLLMQILKIMLHTLIEGKYISKSEKLKMLLKITIKRYHTILNLHQHLIIWELSMVN